MRSLGPYARRFGAAAVVAVAASACSQTENYRSQTEDFIEDEVSGMVTGYDAEVSVDCDPPSSTDVGATYDCLLDVDGTQFTWTVTIDGKNSYEVECVRFIEAFYCPVAETDE